MLTRKVAAIICCGAMVGWPAFAHAAVSVDSTAVAVATKTDFEQLMQAKDTLLGGMLAPNDNERLMEMYIDELSPDNLRYWAAMRIAAGGSGDFSVELVARLITHMRDISTDPQQLLWHEQTIMIMGGLGPLAAAAAPDLVRYIDIASNDAEYQTAYLAAASLARIGPLAVPEMTRVLERNHSPQALICVMDVLRSMGASAEPSLPVLRILSQKNIDYYDIKTGDKEEVYNYISRHILDTILTISPVESSNIAVYIIALTSHNPDVRSAATKALIKIGPDSLPALMEFLRTSQHKQDSVIDHAHREVVLIVNDFLAVDRGLIKGLSTVDLVVWVSTLGRVGGDLAVDLLTEQLKLELSGEAQRDDMEQVRVYRSLVMAIGKLGPDAALAVPTLIAVLQQYPDDMLLTPLLINTLAEIGIGAKEAIPVLTEYIDNAQRAYTYKFAELAAGAMVTIDAETAVKELVAILEQSVSINALELACDALSKAGDKGHVAIPVLLKLAEQPIGYFKIDVHQQEHARGFYERFMKIVQDNLLRLKHYSVAFVPYYLDVYLQEGSLLAHQALVTLGAKAVPFLTEQLDKNELERSLLIVDILAQIGVGAKGGVASLNSFLSMLEPTGQFNYREQRLRVRVAINRASGHAENSPQDLVTKLYSKGYVQAFESLVVVGERVVPLLQPLLGDKDEIVMVRAVRVLGMIGPAAKAALPALKKLYARSDLYYERPDIDVAIKKIDK